MVAIDLADSLLAALLVEDRPPLDHHPEPFALPAAERIVAGTLLLEELEIQQPSGVVPR